VDCIYLFERMPCDLDVFSTVLFENFDDFQSNVLHEKGIFFSLKYFWAVRDQWLVEKNASSERSGFLFVISK